MTAISVKGLIECGVHFGHRVSRWNPKMAPYIYGKRNLIHIINLQQTLRGIIRATHFLGKTAAFGELILFIGTKRQAKSVIEEEAQKSGMPYVSERWLGGTLTNYDVIRRRLKRLELIESMEQDDSLNLLNKKEISRLMREKRKLLRNLDGIRTLNRLPGAIVVVDPKREANAVREAYRLGIPVIAILDTDCDPAMIDICIPGNDDAMRSVQSIVSSLSGSISAGRKAFREYQAVEEKKKADAREKEKASPIKKVTFQEGRSVDGRDRGRGDKPGEGGKRGGGGKPSRPRKPRVSPKPKPPDAKPAPTTEKVEGQEAAPAQKEAPGASSPPQKKTDGHVSPVEKLQKEAPPSPPSGEGDSSAEVAKTTPEEAGSPDSKKDEGFGIPS